MIEMAGPQSAALHRAAAFARLALTTLAAAILLGAIGSYPTVAAAGSEALPAMFGGLAVAVAGAWAGSAPTVWYLNQPPQKHAIGILAGLATRFAATVGLTFAVWAVAGALRVPLEWRPFLVWVGFSQLVLVAIDVWGLVGLLKRAAREGL